MAEYSFLHFSYFFSILALSLSSYCSSADDDRQVYIAYMGALPAYGDYSPSSHHLSILQEVVPSSSVENLLVRNYKRSFNGFAAKLTEAEKEKLAAMAGVVSVFPNVNYQLQTTRSWDFMGFPTTVKRNLTVESNIIIGVIDTGIWPESESFNDNGFGPPPEKWKGACKGGLNFTCNNKLIGARYYTDKESINATVRDDDGHGTHTASTAAGREVNGVSFFGLAQGIARGGIPSARIAAYKVCNKSDCNSDAILAAFDDAIADGVDIISISLGMSTALTFDQDAIAIGALHAIEHGILTVNSVGNSGPTMATAYSVAPWILSAAASSIDRLFISKVVLGNGMTLVGQSVNSFDLGGKKYPLIRGSNATNGSCLSGEDLCIPGCLDPELVKGKIVLCNLDGDLESFPAEAVGAIATDLPSPDDPFIEPFPLSILSKEDYGKVLSYMESTKEATATIMKSETVKDQRAPQVVSFSSRGPNRIAADILKPDLTAPGVVILAAYSPVVPRSDRDTRHVKYNVISGTSMSCPHVAGIAGYLKTVHPDWSPSVIKSALMTSAWPMNTTQGLEKEFAYGSGHINPIQATDPGLVYEVVKADYINMLCGLNFTESMIKAITGDNKAKCPKGLDISAVRNLNYPSLTAWVLPAKPFRIDFNRTVTNVGSRNSMYQAKVVTGDPSVKIQVVPETLHFEALDEKKSFTVTVTGKRPSSHVSSSLVWYDGKHSVRSPIVLYS